MFAMLMLDVGNDGPVSALTKQFSYIATAGPGDAIELTSQHNNQVNTVGTIRLQQCWHHLQPIQD